MRKFFKQYIPYYKNYKLEFFYAAIGIVLVASATAGTLQGRYRRCGANRQHSRAHRPG